MAEPISFLTFLYALILLAPVQRMLQEEHISMCLRRQISQVMTLQMCESDLLWDRSLWWEQATVNKEKARTSKLHLPLTNFLCRTASTSAGILYSGAYMAHKA